MTTHVRPGPSDLRRIAPVEGRAPTGLAGTSSRSAVVVADRDLVVQSARGLLAAFKRWLPPEFGFVAL